MTPKPPDGPSAEPGEWPLTPGWASDEAPRPKEAAGAATVARNRHSSPDWSLARIE